MTVDGPVPEGMPARPSLRMPDRVPEPLSEPLPERKPDRRPEPLSERVPEPLSGPLSEPLPRPVVPDLIVLAGGRGSRLGGAAKPSVEVAGRTLLSRALDARTLARRTVVVGPESSRPAAGVDAEAVLWTLEDPPLGGPVAGVAAGLAALERAGSGTGRGTGTTVPPAGAADWVLLLACDLPWAADAARVLLAAADAVPLGAVDGIHLVDADGRAQWLTGLYRATALGEAVRRAGADVRGGSMRGLLARLALRGIRDESNAGRDVDTWQDVAETEAILNPPAGAANSGESGAEPS